MTPITRDRELMWLDVPKIIPNKNNPRGKTKPAFTPEQLESLRASIKQHGMLQPVIVEPYKDDLYLLIDGERRFTSAQLEDIKQIPAIVINRQNDHDQLVVMYNVHTQHRGWEKAEELLAIKKLLEKNGTKSDEEMAKDLGISLGTYKNRLGVLLMGEKVVTEIASGKIDYSSAMRIDEVARSLSKKRPQLVKSLGGEANVEKHLLRKAKERGGISQELVEIRRDLTEADTVSDEVVKEYITTPAMTKRDIRQKTKSLDERRRVEDLAKELRRVTTDIRKFRVNLVDAPNLRELRRAVAALMDAGQVLEEQIVEALMKESGSGQ